MLFYQVSSFLLFLSSILEELIHLYFLIPAGITKCFDTNTEFTMPIGILTKEVKEEIETHAVIANAKISKCVFNII